MSDRVKEIEKQVGEYYDDDARYVLESKNGNIHFIKSNHHNGELYLLVTPDNFDFAQAVKEKAESQAPGESGMTLAQYGGICYVVEKVILDRKPTVIGYGLDADN